MTKTRMQKFTSWLMALIMLTVIIPAFSLTVSAEENFYIVAGSWELCGVN